MNINNKGNAGVVVWAMGILVWINLLSALISTYHFGYVDWSTVAQMGAIAFPPLAVGAVAVFRMTAPELAREHARVRKPIEAGR